MALFSGENVVRFGKALLAITGVAVVGSVTGCVIWPGEPCLAGLIGAVVCTFTFIPGLVLYAIGKVMTRADAD